MDHVRLERASGTLDGCRLPLDQVEHMHALATRVVLDWLTEPMTARLDKLAAVKACSLLAPPVAFGDRFDRVDQMLPRPTFIALPLDVGRSALDIDRARLTVEIESRPIPELEGEDVRRGLTPERLRPRPPILHASSFRHLRWQRGDYFFVCGARLTPFL